MSLHTNTQAVILSLIPGINCLGIQGYIVDHSDALGKHQRNVSIALFIFAVTFLCLTIFVKNIPKRVPFKQAIDGDECDKECLQHYFTERGYTYTGYVTAALSAVSAALALAILIRSK